MVKRGLDEFKVGIFVAAGLLLAMITVFMISSDSKLFHSYYTIYTNFNNISGLNVGAPVQLAGLKVGFVDDIKFPEDPAKKQITVVLNINKKYQKRIRSDSVATIETQGLLGDKFIYVSVGSEAQSAIPEKGILLGRDITSIFSLAEKAGEIMDDIGDASSTINEMLTSVKGKGEGDLKAIVSSVKKTVEQVEKGRGFAHALIYDPKGEKLMSDLAETISSMKGVVEGAEEESKGQMGGLISNLRTASGDLKEILGTIKRGEGTIGKLINDPSLYDDLVALFGRANRNKLVRAVIRSTMKENDKTLESE
jgi:phospholipid/cholesterol/gamma-HCH transport system substrate-binding protein